MKTASERCTGRNIKRKKTSNVRLVIYGRKKVNIPAMLMKSKTFE
jgi:hypothetical protein